MKKLALVLPALLIAGCSSAPTASTPESTPDRVIARIDDLSSRPSWLKESESFKVESGEVISLGQTTIPADHRVEAAYRIAENSAKAGIASAIEQRLEFVFQNAEEGTALGSTQARYIGAEASKLVTNSIRPSKRYWEKVATTDDSGNRKTIYRVFASVTMPEPDFKRAIMDAISKAQGKGGLSADFAKKVDAHWDSFTNANHPAKE